MATEPMATRLARAGILHTVNGKPPKGTEVVVKPTTRRRDVTVTMDRRAMKVVAAVVAAATHMDPADLGLPPSTNLTRLDGAYDKIRAGLDA